MAILSAAEWDEFLAGQSDAHILQTSAWAELKTAFGWDVVRVCRNDTGAQVLLRRLPLGFSIAYIAKGPVGETWLPLWEELDAFCRQRRVAFLKVEPDLWMPLPAQTQTALSTFLRGQPIQPQRTILINLDGEEETWLQRMKQKTRYNIHLAKKKGVTVCQSEDVATFAALMAQTGQRDGFGVHSLAYYQRAYDLFAPSGRCVLLMAQFETRPLGGLMVFAQGARAWYFYGASSDAERNRMPSYLLQWEAMRWAAGKGCAVYDLWGIPDCDEEILESQFSQRSDGLWGVYRFKRGFGGKIVRSVGAFDRVYSPLLYRFYRWWLARRSI
ncbi:MAG: peptidoglycan bridge formation glycyltransferase FemA/FemB family protein [Anaerolineae bacterium]|nr:peptidoglycan bridge formation glycyltransferase FemA/FemB family protein [Anaerolineae bacterium]